MSKPYGSSPYLGPNGQQTVLGPDESVNFPIVFWDDFLAYDAAATTAGEWLETIAGTGSPTVLQDGSVGGAIDFTINDAADNFLSLQGHSLGFLCAAGKNTVIETRVKVADRTKSIFMIGLGEADTTTITATDNFIGFKFNAGTLTSHAEKAGATSATTIGTTTTGTTLTNATYMKLRVEIDGVTSARFYCDDVLKATHETAGIPIVGLTQTIEFSGNHVDADGTVDYIYVSQDR